MAVPIFAVSTYNTNYVLIQEESAGRAISILAASRTLVDLLTFSNPAGY